MKSLKESILADMDDILQSGEEAIKYSIEQWLKKYNIKKQIFNINKNPNGNKFKLYRHINKYEGI